MNTVPGTDSGGKNSISGLRSRLISLLPLILIFGVLALRLYYCTQRPINSGDIVRHLLYGRIVVQEGFPWADVPLESMAPDMNRISGSGVPYNYPVLALCFFVLVSLIQPSIFFAKITLTAIEAANSWLIFRTTKEKWLGVIYWCSPVSIWWTSREGQFEPVQNLCAFLGFFLLSRWPWLAFLSLAMGIQVKLTAVFLLPYFLFSVYRKGAKQIALCCAAFVAGFLPTAISLFYYPSLNWLTYNPSLYINPYYWNFLERSIFVWRYPGSMWVRVGNQVTSYGFLAALIWGAFHFRKPVEHFASAAFLAICKLHTLVQFWYMILVPSFLLSIQERKWRLLLFALAPLLDVYSLLQILFGPFGFVHGYYGPKSVFEVFQFR